jgi:circadian clock protein KaiB
MSEQNPNDSNKAFDRALKDSLDSKYILRLYVAGNTEKSVRAILNLRRVCEIHLKNRFLLEVIDIYQYPEEAKSAQIIATPTLIKLLPLPIRRIIGDLSESDRVLLGLNLVERE